MDLQARPAFYVNFNIRPEVIRDEILPLIDQISREKNAPVIDLYTALQDWAKLFPDGIHPNAEGAGLMTQAIAPFLLGVRFLPDFDHDGALNFVDFVRRRPCAERRRADRQSRPRRARPLLDDVPRHSRTLEIR